MFPERLRPLVDATADLSDRFRAAGHTLYLVGGSVRDAIVADDDAPAADVGPDLDFTTDARPDDIEAVLRGWADAIWTQGKRFGTIACLRGDQKYEITTHRAEAYHPDSRKPDVAFGDSIEDDLARRDFTVNAMALRLPELELIDPFGGLVDLAERRLRTPLDPDVSFADDPLRMLRAARFIARLDLEPTDELVAAVRAGPPTGSSIVSAERIRDELDKIMVVAGPVDRPVVRGPDRVWPTSSCPSCPASPSSRTRSTATRTCWPTPWPWWTRRRRTACCAWPPSSTTWASRGPGPSSTAGSPSTTTRWWGPG